MNNKGFTLIELLATIMLLALITSVGAYAVINFINGSKENSYILIVKNAKIGAQEYFEECENIDIMGSDLPEEACENLINNNVAIISFGNLVKYGYLKSSSFDNSGNKIIENPKTNSPMNECMLKITKKIGSNYSVSYEYQSTGGEGCPTTSEYNN